MLNWFIAKWEIFKAYLTAPFDWFSWFFTEWLPQLVFDFLDSIGSALNSLNLYLSPSSIGVDLGLVNAFFPFSEFMAILASLISLALTVQSVKWVMKFIPTIG